ncbi:lytic transglycosylase domain-containing protein [Virgibacillus flavescens]|uniref:lytic transglycosylase domain-containing protein n=1 Tax=Virgibacillus flavescens TaxID=1611422 RepID=UPI003D338838
MKTGYSIKKMLFVFLGISVVSFTMIFMLLQEKQELKERNKFLAAKNQSLIVKSEYLGADPLLNSTTHSYSQWSNQNNTAARFVKDSNGKFKKSWALYLVKEAKLYDVNPHIAYELLKVETGGTFDPTLVGPKTKYGRAYGMAQFMKNTAPWIADMAGVPYSHEMLFDPYYSIHLSFVYLDFLHEQYGNWDKALTAYNRGMGGLQSFIEENGHAESSYSAEILTNANAYPEVTLAE